jgi:hypothetical protein
MVIKVYVSKCSGNMEVSVSCNSVITATESFELAKRVTPAIGPVRLLPMSGRLCSGRKSDCSGISSL